MHHQQTFSPNSIQYYSVYMTNAHRTVCGLKGHPGIFQGWRVSTHTLGFPSGHLSVWLTKAWWSITKCYLSRYKHAQSWYQICPECRHYDTLSMWTPSKVSHHMLEWWRRVMIVMTCHCVRKPTRTCRLLNCRWRLQKHTYSHIPSPDTPHALWKYTNTGN